MILPVEPMPTDSYVALGMARFFGVSEIHKFDALFDFADVYINRPLSIMPYLNFCDSFSAISKVLNFEALSKSAFALDHYNLDR